jgi:hypothetical protein
VNPTVIVEFLANTDKLQKGLGDIDKSGSKAKATVKKAFVPAIAILGAVGVAAGKAVSAASALNEQMSASSVTFGSNAKAVQDWSKSSAKDFGLSRTEALKAANGFGNMLTTAGLAAPKVAEFSKELVKLGGDMASFFDQDPSEMLDKLRSGLAGEAEPLRKFGINLSADAVAAEALAMGLAKPVKDAGKIATAHQKVTLATNAYAKAIKEHGKGSDQAIRAGITLKGTEEALARAVKGKTPTLTEAQKVQARYKLIMDQTAKAHGDFAKTATGVANSQRTAAAETENASAAFGKALLPVVSAVMGVFIRLLTFLGKYPGLVQTIVGVIAALAAIIVVLNVAMTVAAFLASGFALPFILVAVAVIALIAAFVLLWKNWDKVSAALKAGFDKVKSAASAAFNWIKANWQTLAMILFGPFGVAFVIIARYWSQITGAARSALDAIRSALSSFKAWVSGIASSIGSIVGKIGDKFHAIGDAAHSAVASVKSAINGLIDWLGGIVSRMRGKAESIANAIKGPINSVLRAIGGIRITIPKIPIPKVSLPGGKSFGGGSVGGGSVSFPMPPLLARGGVLTSPTLFIGGEAGTEIVAPEALLRSIMEEHGGGYTLNIYPRTADAATVAYGFRRLELLRTAR